MLQAFLQAAYQLFFPDNCLVCRQFLNSRHQKQLCISCQKGLVLNPLPFNMPKAALAFDQAWSVCLYNETAQQLLHAFKYKSKTSLHKTFVPLMIDFIDRHHIPLHEFDYLSPVPLHPVRLRERGYNQSSLLSLRLSQHYQMPHREDLLIRQKITVTQTELGAKQRWTNMSGAFRIQNSTDITGKSIILVDDLLTTGATLHYAAEVLKKAGAAKVAALTLSIAA